MIKVQSKLSQQNKLWKRDEKKKWENPGNKYSYIKWISKTNMDGKKYT